VDRNWISNELHSIKIFRSNCLRDLIGELYSSWPLWQLYQSVNIKQMCIGNPGKLSRWLARIALWFAIWVHWSINRAMAATNRLMQSEVVRLKDVLQPIWCWY